MCWLLLLLLFVKKKINLYIYICVCVCMCIKATTWLCLWNMLFIIYKMTLTCHDNLMSSLCHVSYMYASNNIRVYNIPPSLHSTILLCFVLMSVWVCFVWRFNAHFFIHSFNRSFIQSFVCSFIHSFHSFISNREKQKTKKKKAQHCAVLHLIKIQLNFNLHEPKCSINQSRAEQSRIELKPKKITFARVFIKKFISIS